VGLLAIAMLLSLFGARLFQLQGVDSKAYASRAEAAGLVNIALPAKRGQILDRNGTPLAESVAGMMVVADPTRTTPNAEAIAKLLADRLHLDYFDLLGKLTKKNDTTRFVYIARRIPSTLASSTMDELKAHNYVGVDTRPDPLRTYPAGDVAANLIGYLGNDPTKVSGGLERSFNGMLAGKDGKETYEVGGGNRIPLGDNSQVDPVNGKNLKLTIDRDVQWFSQRVLRTAVESAKAHRRDPRAGRLPDLRRQQARQGSQGRPRQPGAQRRLRAGVGREGADHVVAHRRRQGHPAHPVHHPGRAPRARPGDR
jgi:cell division protein FtsI (penicillin-binding protein 3)